jgi:hypothetical protein
VVEMRYFPLVELHTTQFSPRTKWGHLLLVPFLELTRRWKSGIRTGAFARLGECFGFRDRSLVI